jgi:uncharacterized protein with GYD domain
MRRKGGLAVQTYICLMKLTRKGIEDIKNAPQRLEQSIKTLESMGGKLVAFYMTMGEYDYVGIAEAPSDEVAMSYLLGLGGAGFVRTTTLKGFNMQQISEMVKGLP